MIVREPFIGNNLTDFNTKHLTFLNVTLPNFRVQNYSTSSILGDSTQMLSFNYNNGTELYKGLQLWKLTENRAVIFTYFVPDLTLFDTYLPEATRMLESLEIANIE